jgi:hypothetical protein
MTFGKGHENLVYFIPFWYFVPRKIWQPWFNSLHAPFLQKKEPIDIDRYPVYEARAYIGIDVILTLLVDFYIY